MPLVYIRKLSMYFKVLKTYVSLAQWVNKDLAPHWFSHVPWDSCFPDEHPLWVFLSWWIVLVSSWAFLYSSKWAQQTPGSGVHSWALLLTESSTMFWGSATAHNYFHDLLKPNFWVLSVLGCGDLLGGYLSTLFLWWLISLQFMSICCMYVHIYSDLA